MLGSKIGSPLAIYRGLSGPPGPKPRKSSPGASGPGTPRESGKSLEKVWRVWKKSRKGSERRFRDFFQTLGGPGAGGPGRLFSDFFGVSGPQGARDACKWPTGSQVEKDKYCWHPNHYILKNTLLGINLCNVIDFIYIMNFSRESICVM